LEKVFSPDIGTQFLDDGRLITQNHEALDHILQFPDITGPLMTHKHLHQFPRRWAYLFLVFLGVFIEKTVNKDGNLLLSLSQGGYKDIDHVQSIVQILPEMAIPYGFFEVFISGHQNTDIDLDIGFTP